MIDIMHDECGHGPFNYRPYRRGRLRCYICGQHLPLSYYGKMAAERMYGAATKPIFLRRFMT